MQWFRVQAVQRGEHLTGLAGYPVLVRSRDGGPGGGQFGAGELRHEQVTPAVLVLAAGEDFGRGDGQPAVEVVQHPGLGDAVRRGHRGIELENAAVADGVNGTGAARVTAQPGARQAEAGREIFRGRPDEALVPDDGLPLRVRTHRGQHGRKLPRAACCLQLVFSRFGHAHAAEAACEIARASAETPLWAPRCEPVRAGCSPDPPADSDDLAPSRVPAGCGRSMRAGRSRRSGRAGRRPPAASLRPGAPAVCR